MRIEVGDIGAPFPSGHPDRARAGVSRTGAEPGPTQRSRLAAEARRPSSVPCLRRIAARCVAHGMTALAILAAAPAVAQTSAHPTSEAFAADAAGHWSSARQSADPAYDWVEARVVRIWPERDDGVWLYQENAILGDSPDTPADARAAARAAPYFQVVIQLQDLGGGAVYTTTWRVADRAAARGAWATPDAFDRAWLGEASCPGRQQRIAPGYWEGGAACPSSYRGATRLDSRSLRAPGVYVNWDRGFDAAGARVWGPEAGGYVFEKQEPTP